MITGKKPTVDNHWRRG